MAVSATLVSLLTDPPTPVTLGRAAVQFPRGAFSLEGGIFVPGPGDAPDVLAAINPENGVLVQLFGDFPDPLDAAGLADLDALAAWVAEASTARLTAATVLIPDEETGEFTLQLDIDFGAPGPEARTFYEGWTVRTLKSHDPQLNGAPMPGTVPSRNLAGTTGDDYLAGTMLNDTLRGGKGADTLDGSAGNDSLAGLDGADLIRGDIGHDTLAGGTGADTMEGAAGDDLILGAGGNDVGSGGAGSDTLRGGGGADDLTGDEGNDRLFGDGGRDTLNGGTGNDQLTGGTASDTFVFVEGNGFTTVLDFTRAQNDRLLLIQLPGATWGETKAEIIDSYATKIDGHAALRFGASSAVILHGVEDIRDISGKIDLLIL
jgi:Ca2+-binding RTX toxin-like protein